MENKTQDLSMLCYLLTENN